MNAADRIRALPIWPSPPRLRRISAGRTNENFVVESGGRTFFARLGTDRPEHGISREQEGNLARRAAELGIAPEVHFAEGGLLVTDFIDGEPLTPELIMGPERLNAVASLLRTLHQVAPGPDLASFDPVAVCRRYLEILIPSSLDESGRKLIKSLLDATPPLAPTALIHADPVPENFIEDRSGRIWLVDWEYAGIGDPATDLAMLAMNCDLPDPAVARLVEVHGLCSYATVLKLRSVVAAREALWCLVQVQVRGAEGDLIDYTERCLARLGLVRP
jgi:thiamine kinase-like enzyme